MGIPELSCYVTPASYSALFLICYTGVVTSLGPWEAQCNDDSQARNLMASCLPGLEPSWDQGPFILPSVSLLE